MIDKSLPGSEIIEEGIEDLTAGRESICSLLVAIADSSLQALGVPVPRHSFATPEIRLYRILQAEHGDGAHSKYNAWRRRLASYLRAARCAS